MLNPVVRDDFSAPFFDAAARGELLLRWSPSSGEWSEPAALLCSVTQADDLEWRASSGEGALVTWTVKPGRVRDDQRAVDIVIGIVELAEGPWLSVQLPGAERSQLRAGAPVRIEFVQPEGGEHMPVGRVAGD